MNLRQARVRTAVWLLLGALVLVLAWALPADAVTIVGTRQPDTLQGTNRTDALYGRAGDDEIRGGHRHDYLAGGRGDDVIYGGKDSDYIKGGRGEDTCWVTRKDIYRGCESILAPPYWIVEL